MNNEFAIHTNLSIDDMITIKAYLTKTIKMEGLDFVDIKTIISMIDKIDDLVKQFKKEGE